MARFLDENIEERDIGYPYFGNPDYEPLPFGPTNFMSIKQADSDTRAAFIDGGNLEILGAPNFSVQINRIYFNIFEGRTRILPKSMPNKVEFFSHAIHNGFSCRLCLRGIKDKLVQLPYHPIIQEAKK